ncbi:MAG: right-handed parallel beta-helix repeat-containing protein [Kiritimatiellae bacterium]|nr:right-handed parallel beta-helix repeat-containing protein [Kiritimatiellia bacterium]
MYVKMLGVMAVSLLAGQLMPEPATPAEAEPQAPRGPATYFVAPDGADANPGTEAEPWATLKKAAAAVRPGDTVRIRAGVYAEPSVWFKRAGTQANPIIFKAYGDGAVRITPSTLLPRGNWKRVKGAVYVMTLPPKAKKPHVFQDELPLARPGKLFVVKTVDDMVPNSSFTEGKTLYVRLADGSDPNQSDMRWASGHVLILDGCHHTVFDGLTVEYGFNGFKQNNDTHHITIRNCTIRSIASQGIQPIGDDCTIEDCLFRMVGSTRWDHALYGKGKRMVVRNNVFEKISGCAVHQYGRLDDPDSGGSFYGNVFREPRAATDRNQTRERHGTDVLLWSRDENWVYNNVFYGGNKRPGISLKRSNNRIFNNTFVGSRVGITFFPNSTGNTVRNNILVDAGESFVKWPAAAKPQTLDYNLYFRSHGTPQWQVAGTKCSSLSAYQQAGGAEQNSRWADPRLAGAADARLQPDSPAIDAGVAVAQIAADKDGVARPQGKAPDLGAYEFRAAP